MKGWVMNGLVYVLQRRSLRSSHLSHNEQRSWRAACRPVASRFALELCTGQAIYGLMPVRSLGCVQAPSLSSAAHSWGI